MTQHTNAAGRSLAIAAGVILASGTLAILFEDVLMHGAAFTLKHWLTLVTVTGTMMVGHLADLARRHRHWMSVLGFTALFLAGTGLVVYSSVGRQAEKTMVSSAQHDGITRQRMDLEAQITTEREAVKAKRDAADAECADGEGNKCKAKRATAEYYENSLKGLEARLQVLDPAKPVSPEAEELGTVAAALGYDKDKVKALAVMLAPFFLTLFLEFGTIVSFGFAFSPKRQPKLDTRWQPTASETNQTSFPLVATDFTDPTPPKPPKKPKPLPANVVQLRHPVVAALEKVGRPVSNRELAVLLECSEGEAVKRRAEVKDLLDEGWSGKTRQIRLA